MTVHQFVALDRTRLERAATAPAGARRRRRPLNRYNQGQAPAATPHRAGPHERPAPIRCWTDRAWSDQRAPSDDDDDAPGALQLVSDLGANTTAVPARNGRPCTSSSAGPTAPGATSDGSSGCPTTATPTRYNRGQTVHQFVGWTDRARSVQRRQRRVPGDGDPDPLQPGSDTGGNTAPVRRLGRTRRQHTIRAWSDQ